MRLIQAELETHRSGRVKNTDRTLARIEAIRRETGVRGAIDHLIPSVEAPSIAMAGLPGGEEAQAHECRGTGDLTGV